MLARGGSGLWRWRNGVGVMAEKRDGPALLVGNAGPSMRAVVATLVERRAAVVGSDPRLAVLRLIETRLQSAPRNLIRACIGLEDVE